MSNKEKCFEYFNSNKGLKREDLLKGVIGKFGITRLTAENYYSKWEDEKDVEEAVENIFGKDEGREVEKKPNLTDEMILEELNKIGFTYLSVRPNMIKCIADKFNLEEHTAKFRLEELAKKRKANEENKKLEVTKMTEDEINELCENIKFEKGSAIVNEKLKPKKLLKIALLQGKVMNYEIQEGGFLLRQGSSGNVIPMNTRDIDDFIAELKELKDVVM